jgi:hypothetical protein
MLGVIILPSSFVDQAPIHVGILYQNAVRVIWLYIRWTQSQLVVNHVTTSVLQRRKKVRPQRTVFNGFEVVSLERMIL